MKIFRASIICVLLACGSCARSKKLDDLAPTMSLERRVADLEQSGGPSGSLFSENKTVKVYQTLPIIPHGSDSYRLVIAGKSYHNVYAGSYLEIPGKKLICFRTEPPIGASFLHVVPTGDDFKEFEIKLGENS